jgi:hypothetical protein
MNPGFIGAVGMLCAIAIIYFGSRLQMRAWLHEIDSYLYNKFDKLKKQKEDGRKEK